MRPPILLTGLAALVALLAPTTLAHAAAPPVTCGSTLAVDTVLRQDLTCTGPGLKLAPGVTLNMRGHTLAGPADQVGIEIDAQGDNAVINGTLTGWGLGARMYNWPSDEPFDLGTLLVDKVTFRNMARGIDTSAEGGIGRWPKETTISRSSFTGNRIGVYQSWYACNVTIDRSRFTDNDLAVAVDEACGRITDSHFLRNDVGVSLYYGSMTVDGGRFVDNTVAISTSGLGGADVTNITVIGGDVGLSLHDWAAATLSSSVITGTGIGVLLERGAPATIDANAFRANGTAILQRDDPDGPAVITNNTLRLNGDGIVLQATDRPEANQVGGNDVRRSTGWAIYAPGALDLGGNVAHRTGNDPPCVGVVCHAPSS